MKRAMVAMIGLILGAATAFGQAPERWIHIRVLGKGQKAETVRVNVPVSVAEQVLPAIDAHNLHKGKITLERKIEGVDLRALVAAVRNAPDNEFVHVQNPDEDVRVSKSGGYFLVKVRDNKQDKSPEQVDVRIPIAVVNALVSEGNEELNLLAALQTLKTFGDTELVTVTDNEQTVRIWIDSSSTAE
jgi:hypothetical protein